MISSSNQEADLTQEVTLVAGTDTASAGEGDLPSMLSAALDGIIELTGAARGMILLFDPHGELLIDKARSRDRRDLSAGELELRRTLVEAVRAHGIRFSAENLVVPLPLAPADDRPGARRVLVGCVPIHDRGRPCGLVYLEAAGAKAVLPRESLPLAEGLAQLIAVAATRNSGRPWRWRCIDATRWGD